MLLTVSSTALAWLFVVGLLVRLYDDVPAASDVGLDVGLGLGSGIALPQLRQKRVVSEIFAPQNGQYILVLSRRMEGGDWPGTIDLVSPSADFVGSFMFESYRTQEV